MRVGLWHRLALVLAAIFCVAMPVKVIGDEDKADRRFAEFIQKSCLDTAYLSLKQPDPGPARFADQTARCQREAQRNFRPAPFGPRFWLYAAQSLGVAFAAYLASWAIVLTARWVWRGRKYRTGIKTS